MRLPKSQVIEENGRPAFAVVPWAEWQRLATALEEIELAAAADEAKAELVAGREALLPPEVALRIADGDNPVRVARAWRGLSQVELAARTGIRQGYLSEIESGRKRPSLATLRRLARSLDLPASLLLVD